jgi:hypothetical protein
METAAKVTCQPHSVSANYITMGSKIRPPRPQIRLHLCKNRPYCAKLGYVQTMWCHSQKSMKRAGNGHCQPHPAAANDITMGSKIRLPRPQIRLHLSQNRLCCSKLGYVSAMGCHSRAQSPGTSTNHTNHMARHEVYSTFVSTRLLHTFVSPICYQTHTHTPHISATPHKASLKNSSGQQLCLDSFSVHLVSSICPANQHTHTNTHSQMHRGQHVFCLQRCDRQRVLSAIAVPPSSHDSE